MKRFCSLCGQALTKQEGFHPKCFNIAMKLRRYADTVQWDEEVFESNVYDYCLTFVCPHCEHYDTDKNCAPLDCLDKIHERLEKYKLVPVLDWKEVKR